MIEKLIQRYHQGLPGRDFQFKMAAIAKKHIFDAPPTARQSAVLILLFPKWDDWHIVLMERVGNPNDPHSNQISFPGGALEPTDDSLQTCALREAEEEVGIPPQAVKMIGAMTDLYIPVSNFHVHPFLAWMEAPPQYQQQTAEVKQVVEAPLSILQNPAYQKIKDVHTATGILLKDVPYFDIGGKHVWGATAMILSELIEILGRD